MGAPCRVRASLTGGKQYKGALWPGFIVIGTQRCRTSVVIKRVLDLLTSASEAQVEALPEASSRHYKSMSNIIVDNETVLVSSQNWSDSAVSQNREAGLLFRYPEVSQYYTSIFESDWTTAFKKVPTPKKKESVTPEAVMKGNFVQVKAADYQEV